VKDEGCPAPFVQLGTRSANTDLGGTEAARQAVKLFTNGQDTDGLRGILLPAVEHCVH